MRQRPGSSRETALPQSSLQFATEAEVVDTSLEDQNLGNGTIGR